MGRTYCCLKTISVHNMFYPCFAKRKASDKEEFYNILSDCHYFDVINSLLNAFRWKKNSEMLDIHVYLCFYFPD